ncbi:glycosyltransferase family 4 protein [Enterococcus alishanensis]
MKKLRVMLLTYGKLPIPAVKGGAVETLLDSLIEENEKHQLLDLIIVSKDDVAITVFNKTHKFSKVIAVKTKERPLRWFMQKVLNKVWFMLTGKKKNLIPYPEIMTKAQDYLQNTAVDCLVDLNCPERIPIIRTFFSGKLAVYLHNDYLNDQTMNGKEILQQLDGVMSVCDFLAKQIKKIPKVKEMPPFYRVNNGIKLEDYQMASPIEKQTLRSELSLKKDDCVIVFSGRITETKGVHLLLAALDKVKFKKNVKVLILGGTTYSAIKKDNYFKKVMAQAEQLPIEVRFTGYIKKTEVPSYLKAADICAVPSIFHETCCLSAVEAQAMGIPVIVTRIGGIPEYISEDSALLIDYDKNYINNFAKGLDRLIHDDKFRKRLSDQAIKGRNRHSQKRYYEEFVRSIEQLTETEQLKKEESHENINLD